MSKSLETYLNDHLAGAAGAIRHLRELSEHPADARMRDVMRLLLEEIERDKETLEKVMTDLGLQKHRFRLVLGRLAQLASRIKLRFSSSRPGLSHLLALDALTAGIAGKRALWESLDVVQPTVADWRSMIERAESQLSEVRSERRRLAPAFLEN